MALKLLIFDFDGTLVHTAPDIVAAINEFLVRHGHKALPYEKVVPEIGMGLTSLLQRTFPEAKEDAEYFVKLSNEFIADYERLHLTSPKLFPGAKKLLQNWKGKIAIISNKREKYIHSILQHLNLTDLPWVDIIGGDTLEEKKPSCLPFEHVLKKAQCEPDETLMIGDGEPDITGAHNSKIRSVAVSFGYGDVLELQALGAWKTIYSYDELHRLAESLSNA